MSGSENMSVDNHNLDEAENKIGTEKAEFDLHEEKIMKIKSRVSQLDAALTEIKAKTTEEEKEKIVNALFDKHTIGLEVEKKQKILEDKMKQKEEIQREIQLQAERFGSHLLFLSYYYHIQDA